MSSIVIKNIYHMLTYAYQALEAKNFDSIKTEKFDNIYDLFAAILCKGISSLVKKGIYKEYQNEVAPLSSLRGKINLTETVTQNTLAHRQVVCSFDDFSENTPHNRILKTTCQLLLANGALRKENSKKLRQILLYFEKVTPIDLKRFSWKSLQYHRNNITYRMLIDICEMVCSGLLVSKQSGEIKFQHYMDTQHMCKLYEKFILKYYMKHYPQLSPKAARFSWNMEIVRGQNLLPQMQTDITLTCMDKSLIIDAKYYEQSLHKHYDKAILNSQHTYQIYSYVKNFDINHSGKVHGLVLYAQTDEEILPNSEYSKEGNHFYFQTFNLNCDWPVLAGQLNEIADRLIAL